MGTKLDRLVQQENKIRVLKERELQKAFLSSDPAVLMKANIDYNNSIEEKKAGERKSYVIDPYEFQNSMGYKDKNTSMSYNMLKAMARVPIINSIIKTRINQVAAFAEPQKDQYSIGYVIRKKKQPGETNDKLSKEEEREIFELYEFMENCGENNIWGADDFDSFVRKIVRDSLTYDQMTFEVERNMKGEPVDFYAVDGSTIRLADSFDDDDYEDQKAQKIINLSLKKQKGYYPSFVQIYDQNIMASFYPWELCFGIRNPVTDVKNAGYGVSELEDLVSVVTSLIWGEEYNRKFFKQGSAPKGILKVSGNLPDHKLLEFRQNWNATMRGVQNAWKTPILEADKVDWIDLQQSNRDMEFTQWIEFLIKVGCAMYTIDPSEINFPLSGASGTSPMFEGGSGERIKYSRDKGLYPILKHLQKRLNKYIVSSKNPKYELAFVGIDAADPKTQLDIDQKSVQTYKTVNELRKEKNLPPIDNGDTLLDGSFMSAAQQDKQAASMSNQGGEEGGEESIFEEDGGEEDTEKADNPFGKAISDYITKLNTN